MGFMFRRGLSLAPKDELGSMLMLESSRSLRKQSWVKIVRTLGCDSSEGIAVIPVPPPLAPERARLTFPLCWLPVWSREHSTRLLTL